MYDFSIRSVQVQVVLAIEALQHSDRSVRSALARRRVGWGLQSEKKPRIFEIQAFRMSEFGPFWGVRLVMLPFSGMGCYCSPTFRGVSC